MAALAHTLVAAVVLVACQGGGSPSRSARSGPGGAAPGSTSVAGSALAAGQDPATPGPASPGDPGSPDGHPGTPPSTATVQANPASGSSPGQSTPVVPPSSPAPNQPGDLLLSSGFERPVCGTYFTELDAGCEFGIEGDVETGAFGARTGPQALRISRGGSDHMGAIAERALPGGHGFVGVAHRVPAIPDGAIPAGGYIQLQQISPTDGSLPGFTVEVRLYPDRRLGLALFRGDEVVRTDWATPIDQWFYVVVEVTNGARATQRMWVYDAQDRLVDEVSVDLATRQEWTHATRIAQKVGGTNTTLVPMYTYADDWFISTGFRGPTRIGVDGKVLS